MLADDAKARYVADLQAIIAEDPVTKAFVEERAVTADLARVDDLNNHIANAASAEVQAALKALRSVR